MAISLHVCILLDVRGLRHGKPFRQEMTRFNRLLAQMTSTLKQLQKASPIPSNSILSLAGPGVLC